MGPVESRNKLLELVEAKIIELGYSSSDLEYAAGEYKLAICTVPKDIDHIRMAETALILRTTILNACIEHKMRVKAGPFISSLVHDYLDFRRYKWVI